MTIIYVPILLAASLLHDGQPRDLTVQGRLWLVDQSRGQVIIRDERTHLFVRVRPRAGVWFQGWNNGDPLMTRVRRARENHHDDPSFILWTAYDRHGDLHVWMKPRE